MKRILIILCLSTITLVHSQSKQSLDTTADFKNSIGFEIGYNQAYLKDINFSPLNYTGGGILYSLMYTHQIPEGIGIFNVDVDFSAGTIGTDANDFFDSSYTLVNAEISYLRKIYSIEDTWSFFLGGQYNTYAQEIDADEVEATSYLAAHGIGAKALATYRVNAKHRFNTSVVIPVVQILVRPPFNGENVSTQQKIDNGEFLNVLFSGDIATFDAYFALDWKLNYQYELSSKVDLTATYLLRYQNVSGFNKLTQLHNQLSVVLLLKF